MKLNIFTKVILMSVILLFSFGSFSKPTYAEASPTKIEYIKGVVKEIVSERTTKLEDQINYTQTVKIQISDGPEKGKYVTTTYGDVIAVKEDQKLKLNETVILHKIINENVTTYNVDDRYRIPPLILIFVSFAILAIIFAKLKGITSLLGLVMSLLVITSFILPNLQAGNNPILISLFGAFIIAVFSIYLAHGFNLKTTLALSSTLLTLAITVAIAYFFVIYAKLTGQGTEDAVFVQLGSSKINIQGLLLAGIIIGTLGVLDDVTTAQIAAVDEIRKADPSLNFYELYKRGLNVGVEHIASLVNTLVLAYAGASLPLLMLFSTSEDVPIWVIINSQNLAEEIVRTITSSMGLILAVPISTVMAAYVLGVKKYKTGHSHSHSHLHDHFHVH